MQKLTKYQKKIVKELLNPENEVIKYPSDRFYMVKWKRGKEVKKILGDSVIELVIVSSNSFPINKEKGIFGLQLVKWKLEEYLKNNNIEPIKW